MFSAKNGEILQCVLNKFTQIKTSLSNVDAKIKQFGQKLYLYQNS